MPDIGVKKVFMTGDTVGGVWAFTLELAQALQPFGIEVTLATMGAHPTAEQRAEAAAIPNLLLIPSSYKLEWMADPWRDVDESGCWLLDLEHEIAPDVIHLNTLGHGALPFLAPVVMTAHSCVLSWWAAVKREGLPVGWNRYRYEVENSVLSVDLLTAPSTAMLRTVEKNYGPLIGPSRTVFNGRDPAQFHIGEKEPFILSAGRLWDEAKNVATLANVAGHLEWPVYLAGESRHPDGSVARMDGCQLLGQLPASALRECYARASIFALPARYEPFGLSALEAALSGCALVLGNIESLREVWGDAAILVNPDDSHALQNALQELIDKPALRKEIASRCTARAQEFTSERMAREYASVYRSVAARRGAACVS